VASSARRRGAAAAAAAAVLVVRLLPRPPLHHDELALAPGHQLAKHLSARRWRMVDVAVCGGGPGVLVPARGAQARHAQMCLPPHTLLGANHHALTTTHARARMGARVRT
jgi:hypothetical protein